MLIIFLILILFYVWQMMCMVRNKSVYRFRRHLLAMVTQASHADVRSGHAWQWRFEAFETVSYELMLSKFWVPITDFYEDYSFIDPKAAGPRLR
jgi:hypothetical protein